MRNLDKKSCDHYPIQKTSIFQFFKELNDFLPKDNQNKKFEYTFINKPSIKDTIQAIGVPHVEVDIILVNGKSVDLDYLVGGGEDIQVFPGTNQFQEKNVINHLPEYPEKPKFIVDVNLGKVVPKLRLLGFDTSFRNDYEDHQIVEISNIENRIILTRNIGILKYNAVKFGYWVRNIKPHLQVEEVIRKFNLKGKIKPLTRCSSCNDLLIPVEKESIHNLVPKKTNEQFNDFTQCENCRKVYWQGSHVDKILKWIDNL